MAGYVYAPEEKLGPADLKDVEKVVRDYWEAWYTADVDRMQRALHPDSVEHTLNRRILDTRAPYIALDAETASGIVQMTGDRVGVAPEDRAFDVEGLAATHYLASVESRSGGLINYLHLMRFPEGWRIIHSTWTHAGGVIPNQTFDM